MKTLLFALVALFVPLATEASCPKNKKEWQALGPKFLVETAALRGGKADIPDFSALLGKSAQGSALPYKDRKRDYVMVEAKKPDEDLFLSGVMKCDQETQQPVLLSLTWIKGAKSGFVKLKN